MPNKTIYVSQSDLPTFDEAQQLAGEALSAVIARALREYVARHQERGKDMREVTVQVGQHHATREQRFVAAELGKWKGLSEDKAWWLEAVVYCTRKGNWAVYLDYKGYSGLNRAVVKPEHFFTDARHSELVVGASIEELAGKLPEGLTGYLRTLAARQEGPVEYLDI